MNFRNDFFYYAILIDENGKKIAVAVGKHIKNIRRGETIFNNFSIYYFDIGQLIHAPSKRAVFIDERYFGNSKFYFLDQKQNVEKSLIKDNKLKIRLYFYRLSNLLLNYYENAKITP